MTVTVREQIRSMLDSDDDWIERFRATYYPYIHPILRFLFGFEVGYTTERTYVCTVDGGERLERELAGCGFVRNPVASYQRRADDGARSTGSWGLWDHPRLGDERLLHVRCYPQYGSHSKATDVYAHIEYDYLQHPLKHLRQEDIRCEKAVQLMRTVLGP